MLKPEPLTAALSYLLVALLSFLFGASASLSFNNAEVPLTAGLQLALTGDVIISVFGFMFIMYYFLYARQEVLDAPKQDYEYSESFIAKIDTLRRSMTFIIGGSIVWVAIAIGREQGEFFSRSMLLEAFAMASIGIPAIVWLHTTKNLLSHRKNRLRRNAFRFPNRVYFPALFCVTSSFMFGWWTTSDSDGVFVAIALTLQALLMIIYRMETYKDGQCRAFITYWVNGLIFFVLFLLVPLAPAFGGKEPVQSLSFALLFAFAMGVSEVARRVYTHSKTNRYEVFDERSEYYLSGLNWATVIIIPTVPMLSLFNPTLPAWFLAIYSIAHMLWWIWSKNPQDQYRTSRIAVGFGITLAVWLILAQHVGQLFGLPALLVDNNNHGNGYSLVSAIVLFSAAMLAYDPKEFMKMFRRRNPFADKRAALFLFVAFAILFIIYTSILSSMSELFEGPLFSSNDFKSRIWEMQQIMVILVVLSTVVFVIRHGISDHKGGGNGEQGTSGENLVPNSLEGNEIENNIKSVTSAFSAFVNLGRPLISTLAGLSLLIILLFSGQSSFALSTLACALLIVITMFGFTVNDVFDQEKDRKGERDDKPLVNGKVMASDAWRALVFSIAIILSATLLFFNFNT
ncbi:MAG: hypothetical protein AAGB04_27160, partial [Pseudomonadota bacterium]